MCVPLKVKRLTRWSFNKVRLDDGTWVQAVIYFLEALFSLNKGSAHQAITKDTFISSWRGWIASYGNIGRKKQEEIVVKLEERIGSLFKKLISNPNCPIVRFEGGIRGGTKWFLLQSYKIS